MCCSIFLSSSSPTSSFFSRQISRTRINAIYSIMTIRHRIFSIPKEKENLSCVRLNRKYKNLNIHLSFSFNEIKIK